MPFGYVPSQGFGRLNALTLGPPEKHNAGDKKEADKPHRGEPGIVTGQETIGIEATESIRSACFQKGYHPAEKPGEYQQHAEYRLEPSFYFSFMRNLIGSRLSWMHGFTQGR